VTGDASIRAKNGEERGQLGRFAAQNRTKLTKFDHGFWIDLLIPQRLRGIFAFLAPQKFLYLISALQKAASVKTCILPT
jgi:hypothetical protein